MITSTNALGIAGELIAMAEFVKLGFEVFAPVSDGNSQVDFIALDNKRIIRVNVKSTANKCGKSAYRTSIRATRPGSKTSSARHKLFDASSCDILSIYIHPIETMCFINSKEISSTSSITLSEKHSKNAIKQRLISDYTSLEKALLA